MSEWNRAMSMDEIQSLTTEDVVAVFMVHEAVAPPAGYDYEEHVMNYLLPNLAGEGFTNYESAWGADPHDSSESSPVGRFIKGNGGEFTP